MRAERFESLGTRSVYALVARIVNEPMLPSTRDDLGDWTCQRLDHIATKSQYFAAANVARATCYVPQGITFWWVQYWPGFAYVVIVGVIHTLLVVVERYKRALAGHWRTGAPSVEEDEVVEQAQCPPALFKPFRFETEAFYRRIGLEWFRRFSTWVMSTLTYGLGSERLTFIAQPSRKQVISFERETRVSEAVHWASAISVTPLVALSWAGAPTSIALWSSFIVFGDVMLALLQRYHRSRVWPIIRRNLERQG